MRHAKIGLQLVMERRAREDFNQFYQDAAKQDYISRQKAEFETRTISQFQSREIVRRALKRKRDAEYNVDVRRGRLADLLRADEVGYCTEIENVAETPLQRRGRLQLQLNELHQEQEEAHDADVKRRLYNKWVEECDPLRAKISLAFEQQIAEERKGQLIEHDLQRVRDDQAEASYVDVVYEGVRQFRERQAEEEWDYRRKQRQNKATWIGQMDRHAAILADEAAKDMEEGRRLRRQNEADKIQAVKDAEAQRRARLERGRELNELNLDQVAYRRAQSDAERTLDLLYLDQAKEDLRKEQEANVVARLVAQKKARLNQGLCNGLSSAKAAQEEAAEMYVRQAEAEANWKQDEVWRIDAEKRRKLMLDANQFQIRQMRDHQDARERRKVDKVDERREAMEQLATARRRDREEAEQRRMMIHNQHAMLDTQVAQRRYNTARAKQEDDDSVRDLLAGWADEERRINEALKHPENFIGKRWRGHR
jgi:hypothetical protein